MDQESRIFAVIPDDPLSLITENRQVLNYLHEYPSKIAFDRAVVKAILQATYTDKAFVKVTLGPLSGNFRRIQHCDDLEKDLAKLLEHPEIIAGGVGPSIEIAIKTLRAHRERVEHVALWLKDLSDTSFKSLNQLAGFQAFLIFKYLRACVKKGQQKGQCTDSEIHALIAELFTKVFAKAFSKAWVGITPNDIKTACDNTRRIDPRSEGGKLLKQTEQHTRDYLKKAGYQKQILDIIHKV